MNNTDPMDLAAMVLASSARALALLLVHATALILTLSGWRPAPPPPAPLVHPLHELLAKVSTAELRQACRAAGRGPGRSRATALAALAA